MRVLTRLAAGVAAGAISIGVAHAQTPPSAAASQTGTPTTPADQAGTTAPLSGDAAVEDIVVTAAGRAQLVQDVPIAINVISGDALVNAGVNDVRDIRALTPSLQATTAQSAATSVVLSIRGIGTGGDNPGFEPAVGVFIDGVFRARAGVALGELPPIERVEVLRGPQGTLFGRNTSAGALSIVTQGPSFDLHGYGEVSYGNYNEVDVKAGLTGPVSEALALRVDGGYHRRDGYIRDLNSDRSFNNLDRYYARGQALFDKGDVRFRLIADYAETNEDCCAAANAVAGPTAPVVNGYAAAIGLVGLNPISQRYAQAASPNRSYGEAVKEYGVSGQFDVDLGSLNLTSITAYRDWKARRNQDIDFSGIDRAYRDGYRTGLRDFTQELRLQGKIFDDRVDFLVGGFYLNERLTLTDTVRFGTQANQFADAVISGFTRQPGLPNGLQFFGTLGPSVPLFGQVALATNPQLLAAALANPSVFATFNSPVPGNPAGAGNNNDDFRVKTDAFAIFTHNIVNITDRLSLTLGLRYNHERKATTASINNVSPTCAFFQNPALANQLYRQAVLGGPSAALFPLLCNPAITTEFNGAYAGRRSENALTGTAKLAFKLTDDFLIYGGYDRGYKSGGYNLDQASFDTRNVPAGTASDGAQISDLEFRKEKVDAFELGIKTDWGRSFTFNLNGFYQKFYDYQDLFFSGTNFVTDNIPEIVSKGVEAEAVLRPARNFTVNLGYTYLDASVTKVGTGRATTFVGQQLTNQPRNVVVTGVTWTPTLSSDIEGLVHVDMRYSSDYETASRGPNTANDGYAIVNARVGATLSERFTLEAYVENLFDTSYNLTSFAVPEQPDTFAIYPSPPRFYGVRARISF